MADMTAEEYVDALLVTLQVFTEKVVRDAAQFGYKSASVGSPLEEVRIQSVVLIHEQIENSFDTVREGLKLVMNDAP